MIRHQTAKAVVIHRAINLMPLDDTQATYQGFTYDDLAKDYSYDPVAGNIISKFSGLPLSTKGGVMNKKAGPRGSIRLQMNTLAMILHQGFVVDGQQVQLLDKDKSNLKLSNLVVVGTDEPVGVAYCIPTIKEGVVDNITRSCFVVRGGDKQAIYFTKTLEEAIQVRESWELTGILPKHEEWPFWPDFVVKGRLRPSGVAA